MLDVAAYFLPLVFIAVLVARRNHYRRHPLALLSLMALAAVSVLHFDAGMLASDPYHDFLRSTDLPRETWAASIAVLLVGSYSGDLGARLRARARAPHPSRQRAD